ncbi:MAG: GIDE domain-containing protein [Gammaproteobacteria bacterium]
MIEWIQQLEVPTFWFYAFIFIASSAYSSARAFSSLHKKRLIKDTPTSWLRSAAQGYTELIGRGIHIDGPPVISPLSGKECLWYRVKSEEINNQLSRNKPDIFSIFDLFSETTGYIHETESDDLFYLDDDTGRCVIDPEGAKITPTLTRNWYGNSPVPDRGPALGGSSLGYRYKYTEELLLPGDVLYTIGHLHTLGGAGSLSDMKAEVRTLLSDWKENKQQLIERFDQNKDGEISVSEWNIARQIAAQEIADKHASNDLPPVVTMLKKTHDRRRPFLISSEPIYDLIDRYHRNSLVFFLMSILTTSITIWTFSIRL